MALDGVPEVRNVEFQPNADTNADFRRLRFGLWQLGRGVYRTAVCSVRCSREKRRGIIASTTELKKISSLRGASQVLRIQPQAIRSTSSCIMTMLHDGLSIDVSNALSSSGGVGDCDPGGG